MKCFRIFHLLQTADTFFHLDFSSLLRILRYQPIGPSMHPVSTIFSWLDTLPFGTASISGQDLIGRKSLCILSFLQYQEDPSCNLPLLSVYTLQAIHSVRSIMPCPCRRTSPYTPPCHKTQTVCGVTLLAAPGSSGKNTASAVRVHQRVWGMSEEVNTMTMEADTLWRLTRTYRRVLTSPWGLTTQ